MSNRGTIAWRNGEFIPVKDANISVFTHGLHYGIGVFEGIRAYKQNSGGGAIFKLREHMVRFKESLHILGLEIPQTVDDLCHAAVELCKKNNFEECYIRPIAYVADGPLGLSLGKNPPINVDIITWEWGAYLGDEGVKNGIRLRTSSFNRPQVNSVMTRGKITGQYVTSVLAKREATSQGFDEALFLDTEGYIAEGTGENVFMVKDGVIKTTPLTSVLNGITRQTIIQHLKMQGFDIREERFTKDEIWCADEVFLTGTAAEVTPVREIDNRKIGLGKPGPMSMRVQKDYMAMIHGEVPEYGKNWMTPIQ